MRVADRGQPPRDLDQTSRVQSGEDPGAIDAPERFDLGPGYWLPIGDEGQRLQGRAGEPRLSVESQEPANIRRKPGCRGEVHRVPMPDHNPTPRRIVVERG